MQRTNISFWQSASVVIQEGEEPYTTNVCEQMLRRFSEGKMEKTLTNWQWRQFARQKEAHRGRLWKMVGEEQHVRGIHERDRVKRFREQAEEEKQAGIQGQRQLESTAKEYLEQGKCCDDTDCTDRMMKQGFVALKSGDWEEYRSIFRTELKTTEWAFDGTQEAFEQVAQDEAGKLSVVQEIMSRSTGYLRRIIAPAEGQGGVTMFSGK